MTKMVSAKQSEVEQNYFSLFPHEGTSKHRRLLLFLVYSTIKANEGITLNKLQWKLNQNFSLTEEDVHIAVSTLANKSMYNAISKWHPKTNAEHPVVHLRLLKGEDQQHFINEWVDALLIENPGYRKLCVVK